MPIPRDPMDLQTNQIHQKLSFNILQKIGLCEIYANDFYFFHMVIPKSRNIYIKCLNVSSKYGGFVKIKGKYRIKRQCEVLNLNLKLKTLNVCR